MTDKSKFIIHHLVETYHHIRYARAGRFEDPVVEPFAGAVEDSGPLTACPQNSFRLSFLMGGHDELAQTEDCHFLSIYTPSRKGARPVLVWIHGGAYLAGSGEEAAYDGSMLAEEGDIVVVAISYRLGAFGYLHDMDNRIVNLGLKDQIAALRWVRENISCFGGDPDKITLAGQSAGGHSVASILSSSNEPLCRRAIIQSAPFTFRNTVKSARKMLAAFTKIAGKRPSECTTEEILAAQKSYLAASSSMMPFSPLEPDFSGKVTIPSLEKVLVSWQKDDTYPFVALKLGRTERAGNLFHHLIGWIATLIGVTIPSRSYVRKLEKNGIKTETVQFDWRPDASFFGACHCLELMLLFGNWVRWKGTGMLGDTTREQWEQKGKEVRKKWIGFIR